LLSITTSTKLPFKQEEITPGSRGDDASFKFDDPDGFVVQVNGPKYTGAVGADIKGRQGISQTFHAIITLYRWILNSRRAGLLSRVDKPASFTIPFIPTKLTPTPEMQIPARNGRARPIPRPQNIYGMRDV